MRGFSLRRPVAFYRSRSSPSPPPCLHSLFLALFALSPLHHRRLEWSVRLWDFFVATSVKIGDLVCVHVFVYCMCDVSEPSEGRLGYAGNQLELILPLIFSWLSRLLQLCCSFTASGTTQGCDSSSRIGLLI